MAQLTPEPNQSELPETLEETLSSEVWYFLAEVLHEVVKGESPKEQIPISRFSHIDAKLHDLHDYTRDYPLIFNASTELLERVKQAHHSNEFREAIGWLTWLFILRSYGIKYIPDSDSKEEDRVKYWKVVIEPLKITINVARQAKDWNTLILAVGLCDWIGLPKWGAQTLKVLYNQIGKQTIDSRITDIKRKPQMLVEDLLVHRFKCCLEKL